jgi:hypothetical protein
MTYPFRLSISERIWLKEIIKAYFKREKTDLITLCVKLSGKLKDDFDHAKINYKIIRNDTLPTLYSIAYVDPNNPILILADRVFSFN